MNFEVKDIDPFMCTHIIYSFAKVALQPDGTYNLEPYEAHDIEGDYPYYTQFNDLKGKNPELHTILAVGGWAHASDGFTEMVRLGLVNSNDLIHTLLETFASLTLTAPRAKFS